jgi:hypothetical protein
MKILYSIGAAASVLLAACGGGTDSTPATAVPDAPVIGQATAGDSSATVAFETPVSDGGAAITAYRATCTVGTTSVSAMTTNSPAAVRGLTNGVTYTCSVIALNAVGNSPSSAWVSLVPQPASVPSARSYTVVDTGQVTCYDSTTGASAACVGAGHDADYTGNEPSFTKSSDGLTVTDNVTGLTWTQSTDIDGSGRVDYTDKRSPQAANEYCDALTVGGHVDWRLPSLKESYSLILFSGRDASSYTGTDTTTLKPFINSSFDFAFGDITTAAGIAAGDRIIDAQYASTTNYVSTTMLGDATMFGVNFIDGRIKGYPSERKLFYVRCVRGNTDYGKNVLTDNGNLTVSDVAPA